MNYIRLWYCSFASSVVKCESNFQWIFIAGLQRFYEILDEIRISRRHIRLLWYWSKLIKWMPCYHSSRQKNFFDYKTVKCQSQLQKRAFKVFLAHLSWRLAVHPSTQLNNFSSETPGPIFFKPQVEHSVKGGLKNCTNGHSLLSKMAVMSIYG